FGFYLCYVTVSSAVIIAVFGYSFFLRIFLLTISAPAVYLVFRLAKDSPSKAVFCYVTQILLSLYVSASITLLNGAFSNLELIDFITRFFAYFAIILLEYRFLRRPFLRLTAVTENGWLILAMIPCALIVLSVALASYPIPYTQNRVNIIFIYLLLAVIVVIYFSIFQYLFMQYRLQITKQNMDILELQVSNLNEKLAENEAAAEHIRIERHDTRHRFQTIASLVENDDIPAALAYIRASLMQLYEPEKKRYCSNPVLNAVLSSYLEQAKREHIRLETYLAIPYRLPVDAAELSIVFANALENAIHACQKLPENERKITLKCIHKPSLMLEISNTYAGTVAFSEDRLPLASRNGHGIGSRSIAAFCKKHDAFCSFHTENGWFTMKIVI
ncbi:MAG: GHKL domain-containing protein, partial [Lachnospiraceae bacterium]|nr:GHKL domain-containing protein [Lachnospiraceae bacterium]